MDQPKGDAVVFRVAGSAGLAPTVFLHDTGMISTPGGDSRRDLGVTIEAFEAGITSRPVALRAIGGTFQRGVGGRKRTGRNLPQALPCSRN